MYWYKNLPNQQTYEDFKQKKDDTSYKISKTFFEFLILVFLLAVAYILFSGFNYVDISNQCYVRIRYDVLRGDRESFIEALEKIKQTDFVFYKKFCANVNQIHEKECVLQKDKSFNLRNINSDGCYIKGSHAILISPRYTHSSNLIDKRIEVIKKYGNMAIDYWYYDAPNFDE